MPTRRPTRPPGDPRRLEAAVRPDSVHDGQAVAHFLGGNLHHPALLLEGAGRHLGRMGIHGDGCEALGRSDIAQMGAEALLVDRKVVLERQQHRRDDAGRDEGGMAGHR